ncbi:hypothetical protein GUJ93_ZPchr0012g20286 [Zizania palustris]|uniref:non-specific serine/threonine protein kinase n=1 Tax=Zizania palustris TaxID=103762 RepID=A0A8J5WQM3_ZIZPA|nr:hypothetical protein GUJ93_ZPchr0012g20286 [Zizania palustris]
MGVFERKYLCPVHLSNSNSAGLLGSWNNDSLNFCSWSGVTCSNTQSHRVVALDLESFDLNGQIPPCISSLTSLTRIHLPNNQLSGQIPSELGQLNRLEYINLSSNSFSGVIPNTLASSSLQIIDLRSNSLYGEIPPNLSKCSSLQILSLDSNKLTGGIPEGFGMLHNLSVLRLGPIPSTLGNFSSLIWLSLAGNNLQEIGNITSLMRLRMEQNYFTGNIPDSFGYLSNLAVLSLSHNKLSGQIPSSIGKLSQLIELELQENNLNGSIPSALGSCKKLLTMNLSCNTLGGSIPKELFSLYSLSKGLDLSHNNLSGHIPQEIGGLINIGLLKMSNNQIYGIIPNTLVSCIHLESLRLEGNFLEGRIPESLTNLKGISEIDLSRNKLSGEIPEFFQSFSSLNVLNLSFNNLEGQIPAGGIFQNASKVFIQGNNLLCDSSAMFQLPLCDTATARQWHNYHILKIVGLSVAVALVALSCFTAILLRRRKKSKPQHLPSYKELKKFSYADLVKATNGFSSDNLVGSGKYGSVYRGLFESQPHVAAIKVFKLDQLGAPKSFLVECEAFRNTRHRNLVKVITTCSTLDPKGQEFKALILEYMSNGNLQSWLYPTLNGCDTRRSLSLGSRITIAVDIASALDYLHNHCVPPMVHCDLKPGNVLLDDVMGAHIGDFGLVEKAFPGKITEILDPSIRPYCEDEYGNNNFDHESSVMVAMLSCTMQLVKLGISCSAETPRDRPMMKDVYAEVTAIKEEFTILLG